MELKDLENLYKQGDFNGVIRKISDHFPDIGKAPEDFLILKAWCHYHLSNYDEALSLIKIATEKSGKQSQKTLQITVQIMARINDAKMLKEAYDQLPEDNLSALNALAIEAQKEGSEIPLDFIIYKAITHAEKTELTAIHLLNNAAKALFLRGKEKKDLFLAIGTWYFVLDKYGKDQNYHHRAAVLHWITMAYKKLDCMGPAKDSAIASMKLWKKQLTIDPLNKAFIEKYEKAQDLVNELS